MDKMEPSYIVGQSVEDCNHFKKQFGSLLGFFFPKSL